MSGRRATRPRGIEFCRRTVDAWRAGVTSTGNSLSGPVPPLPRSAGGPWRGLPCLARGYGVLGLLGGLVSSTAVTLGFARRSRGAPALSGALALGVVAACTTLLPKVLVVGTVLNPVVGRAAAAPLAPGVLAGGGMVGLGLLRRPGDGSTGSDALESPLALWSAIKMAIAFQLVLLLVPFLEHAWGAAGVLVSAIGVGLMDMDALVVSMARLGEAPGSVTMAARGIAVGVLASTVFKLALVVGLGTGAFRWRAAAGLATIAAALAFGLRLAR